LLLGSCPFTAIIVLRLGLAVAVAVTFLVAVAEGLVTGAAVVLVLEVLAVPFI
jgi:hypothetical protein